MAASRPGPEPSDWIGIGEVARRSGVAASALRFYETRGLIGGARSGGGQRRYPRHVLRRIAFIRAAQNCGLSLAEIAAALDALPDRRTPTVADWKRLSKGWQPLLYARIAALERLRDRLAGCIGCGCLSLGACALYNPGDALAAAGPGAPLLAPPPAKTRGTAASARPPARPRDRAYAAPSRSSDRPAPHSR